MCREEREWCGINMNKQKLVITIYIAQLHIFTSRGKQSTSRDPGVPEQFLYKCYKAALTKLCVLSDPFHRGMTSHFEEFNFRFFLKKKGSHFSRPKEKTGFDESFSFSTKQPNTICRRQVKWWCHTLQDGTKECACKASLNLIVLSERNVKLELLCVQYIYSPSSAQKCLRLPKVRNANFCQRLLGWIPQWTWKAPQWVSGGAFLSYHSVILQACIHKM